MTIVSPLRLPVDDRADLAELVAHPTRPRPFYIGPNHESDGRPSSVAEAHASGRPYAATVADDVLAFDLDESEHPGVAARGALLAAELAADGWPTLAVSSGRPGHRHLWAVVPDAAARRRAVARAATLRLTPRTGQAMRPPGTPHHLGLPVTIDADEANAFAVAVIAARADTDRSTRLDWRELLTTGHWPSGWPGERSRSSMVWLVCIGAIRAGHQLDDVRRMLADEANAGGAGYRARRTRHAKSHADHWLTHYVWPSAKQAALSLPADATEARERLDAIIAAADADRWPGVAGATDRAVLAALVARAYRRGTLTPTMSHRELAEAVPCHRNTATASLRRLVATGRLQVVERGRGRTAVAADGCHGEMAHATRWRLLLPARACDTGGTPPTSTKLSGTTSRGPSRGVVALDACRWRGLGLNAPRVLDALAAGPLTAAELAAALNLDRGNLRVRLLPRLAAYELVTCTAGRWAVVENLELALHAAAEALGLTGKAAEVAAAHAKERADYLDHRERNRPERQQTRKATVATSAAARRTRGLVPLPLPLTEPVEAADASDDDMPLRTPSPPPPEAVEALLALAGGHRDD
jgi:hypothetical protein